jgi:hypothetical protein
MLADLARKVGHVSFLGPLNHTQMRALAFRHSQLSGFERVSQTLERVCSRSRLELPMHVSTRPLRSVPGYAFPFTEQTEHIQKRARLQSVDCGYMLTLDARDSVAFSSIFLTSGFSCSQTELASRPHASNANRRAAEIQCKPV